PSLPPGSRVMRQSTPRSARAAWSAFTWVDLPTPSPRPSFMSRAPLFTEPRSRHPEQLLETDPYPAEEAGLLDRFARGERHDLLTVRHRYDQIGDVLTFGDRRLHRPLIANLHRAGLGEDACR